MSNLMVLTVVVLSSLATMLFSYFYDLYEYKKEMKEYEATVGWLTANDLADYASMFDSDGFRKMSEIAYLSNEKLQLLTKIYFQKTDHEKNRILLDKVLALRRQLILNQWLQQKGFDSYSSQLQELGILSLHDLLFQKAYATEYMRNSDRELLMYYLKKLKESKMDLDSLPVSPKQHWCVTLLFVCGRLLKLTAKVVLLLTLFMVMVALWFTMLLRNVFMSLRHGIMQNGSPGILTLLTQVLRNMSVYFMREYDVKKVHIDWHWKDPSSVGEEKCFTMKFYRNKYSFYNIEHLGTIKVEILVKGDLVHCTLKPDIKNVDVYFTPQIAGDYTISILCGGRFTEKGPFFKTFLPGPVSAEHSSLNINSTYVVMKENEDRIIPLELRDKYDNPCEVSSECFNHLSIVVKQVNDSHDIVNPDLRYIVLEQEQGLIMLKLSEKGSYKATVYYESKAIRDGVVTFIVLSEAEYKRLNEIEKNTDWNLWFECYLVPYEETSVGVDSSKTYKKRKVYTYLTPKCLTVKEYYLRIFPKCLFKVRIKPTTKITLLENLDPITQHPMMKIQTDNSSFVLACEERGLLLAVYGHYFLNSIGGSESFDNKKQYFHSELKRLTSKKADSSTTLRIRRTYLLTDSLKETKGFSSSDWSKCFEIKFVGELGLDYGGPRREWFYLVSEAIFDPQNKLFRTFGNRHALIHPNPHRPEVLKKLRYYEFAGRIVGKCQLECAQDKKRQQHIRARFTRSFLAQILGLNVHWKHFETDDKELYVGKIKFILENDPKDLGLTFTEEVFDPDERLIKVVDLKPNGSLIDVTEENKLEYLQLLADYRLSTSVKEEIGAFMKGLYDVVPENLVSIFDENELELLMCGTEQISVSDLKLHHIQNGTSTTFQKVITWFWTILSSFSQEELSRLLQFTTGCGQLPPGGFSNLSPEFQIIESQDFDMLPTAHTCFNSLYLPNYPSLDAFRRKLSVAINEGCEGFGLM